MFTAAVKDEKTTHNCVTEKQANMIKKKWNVCNSSTL